RAIGVLATKHLDPAASQMHACGHAIDDIARAGESGMDAVAIARLQADAGDAGLGKILSALGGQLRQPPLDQIETGRAAFIRKGKQGGTTVTIVGKAENRSQTGLAERPRRARRVVKIQDLFKPDELIESE